MKRIAIILLALLLCGCSQNGDSTEDILALRQQLLSGKGCSFLAEITADYGDVLYTFTLDCTADSLGNLTFTVVEPERISGITGKIDQTDGCLTFDEQVLLFDTLNEEQLSPVSAPYIFIKTLRGGYISGCGKDGEFAFWRMDDSYRDTAYQVEIWADDKSTPVRTEILWKGRRILSVSVKEFRIL